MLWPLTMISTLFALIIVPTPTVRAVFGTRLRSPPKKRELAMIVSCVSVFMRVRDVSDEPGSLKAMCPSGPTPPRKRADFLFVGLTFGGRVGRVAVENVDVLGKNIDLVEEVGPHKSVVALLVVAGDSAVFVHVESYHIPERDFSLLVQADKVAVHSQRRTTRGAAEHERTFGRRFCFVDAGGDVVGCPARHFFVVVFDDKTHNRLSCYVKVEKLWR